MDNYKISNLPLSGDSADSAESHPWLTDEQNRQAIFSGRSATFGTLDQTELQPLLTYEEQLSVQRVIADFDLSLLPITRDRATSDELEEPFAALAAYQPPTFDDNSQQPFDSQPSSDSGFLEGNDFLEQPEQSQGESDIRGIIIPESTIPDTVSGKCSGKRRTPDPRDRVIVDLPESVINKSSCRSDRLTGKRQKLDSTDTDFLPLPRRTLTESQAAAMPEKSVLFREYIRRQDPDESLRSRVKEETNKWIVECEGSSGKRFMCNYPDCGWRFSTRGNLRVHIFRHINISSYKCPYSECSDKPYFRNATSLKEHMQSCHTYERRYYCEICKKRFGRLEHYKTHFRKIHNLKK